MQQRLRRILFLVALGAGLACATSLDAGEVDARLAAVAADEGSHARSFPVHAQGRVEAWTLLAEARENPRSGLSLRLGRILERGARYRVTVVVGGPYADLTEQVVLNALSLQQGRSLPGLRLVLVTPEAPSDALRTAARQVQARLEERRL